VIFSTGTRTSTSLMGGGLRSPEPTEHTPLIPVIVGQSAAKPQGAVEHLRERKRERDLRPAPWEKTEPAAAPGDAEPKTEAPAVTPPAPAKKEALPPTTPTEGGAGTQ